MPSIMRWRSGLMGLSDIAKAPVSHGVEPHDLETSPGLRVRLQSSTQPDGGEGLAMRKGYRREAGSKGSAEQMCELKAGAPIWRRDDETGETYALKLTAAGAKAIAVEETGPSEGEAEQHADHPVVSVDPAPEPGSDPAAAIDRPNSGWLPHTTRAALTGLRKRGYDVGIDRADKARGSVYRIEPTEMGEDSAAPALRRHRLAKRRRIGPSAPRTCEPVGRRDGEAAKRERPRRGIGPASAIGVRARNARRLGRDPWLTRLLATIPIELQREGLSLPTLKASLRGRWRGNAHPGQVRT